MPKSKRDNLEMIYNLEQAWDLLYAMDKSTNRSASREQRVQLVSALVILKDELGINEDELTTYKVARHNAIHGKTNNG